MSYTLERLVDFVEKCAGGMFALDVRRQTCQNMSKFYNKTITLISLQFLFISFMTSLLQAFLVFMPAHPSPPLLEHISALNKIVTTGCCCCLVKEALEEGSGGGEWDVEHVEDIGTGLVRVSGNQMI